jgi:hypothetical protein
MVFRVDRLKIETVNLKCETNSGRNSINYTLLMAWELQQ